MGIWMRPVGNQRKIVESLTQARVQGFITKSLKRFLGKAFKDLEADYPATLISFASPLGRLDNLRR